MIFRLLAACLAALVLITSAAATDAEFEKLARASGTPDIPGLKIVWLAPWGDVRNAHPWRNIIVHQTEGPSGSARGGAQEQSKNPTRRGVTVWVETDGTVYWAVAETLVPTHGDGANRNDNKYIDNRPTYRQVVRDNSIGVEFAGNYPDVTTGPSCARATAFRSTTSMPTTGSTTRTRAIAKAAGSQRWPGPGESDGQTGFAIHLKNRRINPGRRGSVGGSSAASTRLKK
jgi:hypothetical protein